MVGTRSILILVTLAGAWLAWKTHSLTSNRMFLRILVLVGPLGFIALESGWMVTELGRQPWIIYHIMRTSAAATSMPHLIIPFLTMSCVYLVLAVIAVWLLRTHVVSSPSEEDLRQSAKREASHAI